MKHRFSRNDTSVQRTHQIIQMSTLERTRRYRTQSYRLAPQTAVTASVISRAQLMMSRSFSGLLIILMTLFYPVGAYAQEAPQPETTAAPTTTEAQQPPAQSSPAPQTTSEPAQQPAPPKEPAPAPKTGPKKPPPKPAKPKTGPQKPNGADASKYTYNEQTGLWENGEYAWDPTTGQSRPLKTKDYSYNPETKAWDNTDWRYDSKEGKYVPNAVTMTPQHDGSEIKLDDDATEFFALYNNASISNTVNSTALSGDAWVTGNTTAGSALTGDAMAIANILNLINSTAGLQGGSEIATFSSDIYGDVFGDLYIDPAALAALQPATGMSDGSSSVNVNTDINQKITNDVNLNAQSGDANVSKNTTAGDATSGSATAVANIVNMLNSAISSGSTFLGLLNIYGNLNGDILLPPGLLDMLIAHNTSTKNAQNTNLDVNLNDTQSIINNITTSAESGDANVSKNTSAGNATTGDAQTNVTILNLTGRSVVAANSLLVFVNVLGEWVGVIVDAPAGSTSAVLGTEVTENSHKTADYDINTTNEIVNNVHVSAKSGDANVTSNTKAGNATTGDATASVNVANIVNSSFSLSGWFGVLFINVFGTWNGSFGIDTAAGNKPKTSVKNPGSKQGGNGTAPKVFRFVPAEGGGGNGTTLSSVDMSNPANARAVVQAVQAAQDKFGEKIDKSESKDQSQVAGSISDAASGGGTATRSADYTLPILGFAFGGALLGGERLMSRRQRRRLVV